MEEAPAPAGAFSCIFWYNNYVFQYVDIEQKREERVKYRICEKTNEKDDE